MGWFHHIIQEWLSNLQRTGWEMHPSLELLCSNCSAAEHLSRELRAISRASSICMPHIPLRSAHGAFQAKHCEPQIINSQQGKKKRKKGRGLCTHSRYNSYILAALRHPSTVSGQKPEKTCNFQGNTEWNLYFCLQLMSGKSFATSDNYRRSNFSH